MPTVAHAQHHGVGKEGVYAKARGKCKGVSRDKAHEGRTDGGRDDGGDENSSLGHSCGRKNFGVHRQNVGHGHEGHEASENFGMDVGLVVAQLEELVEKEKFFLEFTTGLVHE